MTVAAIIGYCLTAWGIGYAGGSLISIGRRAIEAIE
jgi:hypothetical protein